MKILQVRQDNKKKHPFVMFRDTPSTVNFWDSSGVFLLLLH